MTLLDYIEKTNFKSEKQSVQAQILLYYLYKENEILEYSSKNISSIFSDAGHRKKLNPSRIIRELKREEIIREIPNSKPKEYEFVPVALQRLERNYAKLWLGLDYIESNDEVINEERFCGKRNSIDKLIKEINCCYSNHCFNACCVLMRKLFEVLLILSYQHHGIDDEIKSKDGNSYQMLSCIVNNAKNNKTLALSRNKQKYDIFKDLGNYSAHNVYFTATYQEVDSIKLDYKAMMDELFQKSGLF